MITTMVIMLRIRKLNRCDTCDRRISDKQTQCYHCRTVEHDRGGKHI